MTRRLVRVLEVHMTSSKHLQNRRRHLRDVLRMRVEWLQAAEVLRNAYIAQSRQLEVLEPAALASSHLE